MTGPSTLPTAHCPLPTKLISNAVAASRQELAEAVRREFEQHHDRSGYRLADLAQSLNISTRSLQRHFKIMGISFRRLLLEFRLQKARGRIASGQRVANAAIDCGINDPSRFAREYKKRFGIYPGEDKPQ